MKLIFKSFKHPMKNSDLRVWCTILLQYKCLGKKNKKKKLSIARSPWDLIWNVCLCARFIKENVNLRLGHISAQQLYLQDRSVCLFSSSNNAWGCQVGTSEGLRSEKIEVFNIQVKICKIQSNVTPRTVSLPRFSKDLQFYFHLNYDIKGQTENTIWSKCEHYVYTH